MSDVKKLGSTLQSDGGMNVEVNNKTQCGWNNSRKIPGIVCKMRIPPHVKRKIHKMIVQSATVYRIEIVPMTSSHVKRLEKIEMRPHCKRHSDEGFFFRVSSDQIVNSVCWSHALVNGPTSKMPASDGGQLLMMWSAVCSGSPQSHAALSASPHFFMDALYYCTDRPQFAVGLESSIVFGSGLLP